MRFIHSGLGQLASAPTSYNGRHRDPGNPIMLESAGDLNNCWRSLSVITFLFSPVHMRTVLPLILFAVFVGGTSSSSLAAVEEVDAEDPLYDVAEVGQFFLHDPQLKFVSKMVTAPWEYKFFMAMMSPTRIAPLDLGSDETELHIDDARVVYRALAKRRTMWCLRSRRRRDCEPLIKFLNYNRRMRMALFIRFGLGEAPAKDAITLLSRVEPGTVVTADHLALIKDFQLVELFGVMCIAMNRESGNRPLHHALDIIRHGIL